MTLRTGQVAVDFTGRTAIVTGAAGIIGSAVALRLAAGGANLCLAGIGDLAALTAELSSFDVGILTAPTDVSDKAQVQDAVIAAVDAFGGVDILVTVAGITSLGSFESISVEDWERVQAINLKGVFLCNQAVIAPMKAKGYVRIVNVGSALAKNGGNPRPWLDPGEQAQAANAAYAAAKAGVHALTLCLAKELAAHGVTVNAVAPGPIASPMTTNFPAALVRQLPVGRMGSAKEVAAAIAFLAAEESAFITGEIVDVNGGLWMD
ncbi:N-acylmannosamine 1-dehydrogenase [Methylocella tundrae]|uniref:N-acylmannosamine 1-dehydrogenase n=1 Tax=Methylocella tundrae TaxID=227605 RepID=A0A8B6M7Y0_METTU|nr:SDR family oxidoreductase [Methylocella tundrae]VTZ51129.1 N-acylmannosamine 1-dehydrogenase [Methylocella tundrae]